jgi:RimJ/RimL family protein N-acetyltransferase
MGIELMPFETNQHGAFLYLLLKEASGTLYDDRMRDAFSRAQDITTDAHRFPGTYFIVAKDGEPVGYIGCLIDIYNIAYLEGASLKKYQNFFIARKATYQYCRYLFETKQVHKIRARVPLFNQQAEIVARAVGFKKEGLSRSELRFNGKYRDVIELGLFPSMLKGKRRRDRAQQRQQ